VVNPHRYIKKYLETLGFCGVTVTAAKKEGLNVLINEMKPGLLIMEAEFYEAGTPYMVGELRKKYPQLNIAVVSVHGYSPSLAAWFIWHGANSYADLGEGCDEFHRGLQLIREGKQYISPLVKSLVDDRDEWPDTGCRKTKRLMECLILLCSGFTPEKIGEELNISRKTVYNHLAGLYKVFHAKNREEMVALAWTLGLVAKDDIRFHGEKTGCAPLPEWAQAKKKTENKLRRLLMADRKPETKNQQGAG
jgi:DNA-binding NarL/FixJ family response regulator